MRCRRCFAIFEDDSELETFCSPCTDERASATTDLDIEQLFAVGGPLSKSNPNYEPRPGQVRLARAVLDALRGGHHLLGEGPCGIGKSKAYGVPAAWLATQGKRVLIVTASIALQEQLVKKDLPDLQRELGWSFDFALMKGKSNFLCKKQLPADGGGLAYQDALDFPELVEWSKTTETGDKSELTFRPSDLVWGRFSTTSDACPGSKCSKYKDCFATRARQEAAAAGIVVTNYHLFFLNMMCGGQILPASDVVILDEAHEAADIARDLLGFSISEHTFKRLANDALKRGESEVGKELKSAAAEVFDTIGRFYDSDYYDKLVRWPVPIKPTRIENAVNEYIGACPKSHLVDNAINAKRRISEGLRMADPNCVYFIEVKDGQPRRISYKARYVTPGPVLRELLWDAYSSVVAVSATMTSDNKFDFVRRELGVPDEARTIAVESPFNFRAQAMLVVPPASALPEPNDPRFVDVAASRVIEVIEACGGRTLGLFTSYRALNAVFERVDRHFHGQRIRIMRQGDKPTAQLITLFKEDVRSVLLATTSFWTGIDVPGEALTGLVIDRIPFGSPDDPVAIRINESDPKAFQNFTVPRSILTLRQGVGRLIRSQRDVGAIVILDKRLVTKSYGARFLHSLPPMARADGTSAIAPFLRGKGVAA